MHKSSNRPRIVLTKSVANSSVLQRLLSIMTPQRLKTFSTIKIICLQNRHERVPHTDNVKDYCMSSNYWKMEITCKDCTMEKVKKIPRDVVLACSVCWKFNDFFFFYKRSTQHCVFLKTIISYYPTLLKFHFAK